MIGKACTVRRDFAVLYDGSLEGDDGSDDEALGLTEEVALSALESHITSMMQNITAEDMENPTATSPALILKKHRDANASGWQNK